MADHESTGKARRGARTTVATGIYADRWGFEAIMDCAAGRRSRRFARGTDLALMKRWRNETKVRLQAAARSGDRILRPLPPVPRHLKGWSYLYVIEGLMSVKIGHAKKPLVRMKELQTGHDARLALRAAVPAHTSLEAALHVRFAYLHLAGEWFMLTPEMERFIDDLQRGVNPALWIWKERPSVAEPTSQAPDLPADAMS